MERKEGQVVQIIGPVIDIKFSNANMPEIHNAISIDNNGTEVIVEVTVHTNQ